MTDEEKKALEIIKFLQDKCIQENGTGMMSIYRIDDLANAIETVLNLIEKQSKEIEELKEKNSKAIGHIEACKTSLGNYILSPNETEYLLSILKGE